MVTFNMYLVCIGTCTPKARMGDDGGAKLEDVQRALGALVFDAGVQNF